MQNLAHALMTECTAGGFTIYMAQIVNTHTNILTDTQYLAIPCLHLKYKGCFYKPVHVAIPGMDLGQAPQNLIS